MSCDADHALK